MSERSTELRLVLKSGPLKGTSLPVGPERLIVGRDPGCDIRLDDAKVSRIHGIFEFVDKRLVYYDNSSTNGSRLNGRLVKQGKLKPGDIVQVGATEIALMERRDFQAISFSSEVSQVRSALPMTSVSPDALARRFTEALQATGTEGPHGNEQEALNRRMANSLRSLYTITAEMSRLLPEKELLRVIGAGVLEVFSGAENLVILLKDRVDGEKYVPAFAIDRHGNRDVQVTVSMTVLKKAVADCSTLVANDAEGDERLASSASIADFSVKTVLCAPLVVGEEVLGAIYMDNRESQNAYDRMDVEIITAIANQAAIALNNARLCETLQLSYHQMLQALVKAIEAKDPYTLGHTQRVKQYALGIGEEMKLTPQRLQRLAMAADLHDIGKIGIREGIINKPGSLTDTEYQSVRDHVEVGERILKPITYLHDLLPWIRGHHERWDGKGYPDNLKGEEIPLEARILAVADAFDAMTSQRPYNTPLTIGQATERITGGSGSHFDPAVVAAFDRYIKRSTSVSKGRTEAAWLDVPSTSSWQVVKAAGEEG